MKKIWLSIIAGLICVSIVLALWIMSPSMTGFSIYKVKSNQPNLTIEKQLLGGDIDTSDNPVYFNDTFIIDSNVNEKATINLETIKTDVQDSCYDYLDDCFVSYYLGDPVTYGYGFGIELFNNDTIQLSKGENKFSISGYCNQYSCPQNISVRMILYVKEKS